MRSIFGCPAAIARVSGETSVGPKGTVTFYPRQDGVLVAADIYRLPQNGPGIYGFHIHEGCSCGGPGFSDTGGHLNLENQEHPCHTGDLPPLFSCGGHAFMATLIEHFRISDIIGRTVVIHSRPDDFTTQPSGNSGEKIACGVIYSAQ